MRSQVQVERPRRTGNRWTSQEIFEQSWSDRGQDSYRTTKLVEFGVAIAIETATGNGFSEPPGSFMKTLIVNKIKNSIYSVDPVEGRVIFAD